MRSRGHLIIKRVFENAAEHLQLTGKPTLRAAHVMDQQVDLRHVRDNLGHESITAPSQYLHADDDERHRATGSGVRLDWSRAPAQSQDHACNQRGAIWNTEGVSVPTVAKGSLPLADGFPDQTENSAAASTVHRATP